MEQTHSKWQICDSFILKVVALLTMTLDHLGLFLSESFLTSDDPLVIAFRTIGRIAMPLFAFMIYEGVKHTKHFGKYALRLGVMATFISVALIVLHYMGDAMYVSASYYGNIFIDLLLGALGAWLITNKNKGIKFLSLLPLAYGITCFAVKVYEATNVAVIHWLPYFIRTQYDWLAIAIPMALMIGYYLKNIFVRNYAVKMGAKEDSLVGTTFDRNAENVINLIAVAFMILLYYACSLVWKFGYMDVQTFALLATVFILLYNGKRGYNRKWFEYGSYLYYPIHIGLLALIFFLVTL